MILDEAEEYAPAARDLPDTIATGDLLAACAVEAARQAQAFGGLDSSLSKAVALLRAAMSDKSQIDRSSLSVLIRDLQMADRLRQESEGLARTLALLAATPASMDRVSAADLRACTVLQALHLRLLTRQ